MINRILISLLLICIAVTFANAQNIIQRQSFESTPNATPWSYTGTPAIVTGNGLLPATNVAADGSAAWGVTNANTTLTFSNVSVSGYSSAYIQFRLAAFSMNTTGNGMEASDSVIVEVSGNGGTSFSRECIVIGSSANNAVWDYSSTSSATVNYSGTNSPQVFQSTGSGASTTGGVSTVRINLSSLSQVTLRITARNNSANERWCIDDVQLVGSAPSKPPVKLAITQITPAIPFAGQSFSYTIQAQDSVGVQQRVSELTEVSLSVAEGSGVLSGATTAILEENESSTTVTGLVYSQVENNIRLLAKVTSGTSLDSALSTPFNVQAVVAPVKWKITSITPTTLVAGRPFTVTVQSQDSNGNSQPLTENKQLQISKVGGTGSLTGTMSINAGVGQSVFNFSGLQYSVAESGLSIVASNSLGSALTSDTVFSISFQQPTSGVTQTVLFEGQSGTGLLSAVVSSYKPSSTPSYDAARNYLYTDVYNVNGKLSCVYTGFTINFTSGSPSNINCEHTFPQSKGADGQAKSDMHHLYPTRPDVNSDRGSYPFGDINENAVQYWYRDSEYRRTSKPTSNILEYSRYASGIFEPRADHKGNVARAVFYFYTMYKSQADSEDPNFFNGMRNVLYRWHYQDPVDSTEYARTQKIAGYQGGKANPFVLDSTLLRRAYFPNIIASASENKSMPTAFTLRQNFPNPFNPSTMIEFQLENSESITLSVMDILGREVALLVNGERRAAGRHQLQFDSNRYKLSSGIYFLRLSAGSNLATVKMMLVK